MRRTTRSSASASPWSSSAALDCAGELEKTVGMRRRGRQSCPGILPKSRRVRVQWRQRRQQKRYRRAVSKKKRSVKEVNHKKKIRWQTQKSEKE